MNKFKEKLAELINVKTLVTFAVMVVFVVLTLKGSIASDNAMIIISMVVSFYFGTQHQKNGSTAVATVGNPSSQVVAQLPEQAEPVTASVDNATYYQTHPDSA